MKKYFTVDVFTNKLFGGNPLAVFIDAEKLSTSQMQSIASEINYSETAFVLKPDNPKNSAKVRIFTPKSELSFAGHPNVGTGFILSKNPELIPGEYSNEKLVFEEIAGLVDIFPQYEKDNIIKGCSIKAPSNFKISSILPVSIIADCLSVSEKSISIKRSKPVIGGVGLDFGIVEVRDKRVLSSCRCNISAFEKAEKKFGNGDYPFSLLAFSEENKSNYSVRVFAPLDGIIEDPATGSACGALGGLLASFTKETSGSFNYTMRQGKEIGRPSIIEISVVKKNKTSENPMIKGNCIEVSEGIFYL